MAIITKMYDFSFGCFVCEKKPMSKRRKYLDFCSVKCQRKGASKLNELMDKAFSGSITNANFRLE